MTLDDLNRILIACDDSTSRTLASGARFIRKLPGNLPLAYLHGLFAPLSPSDYQALQDALDGRLPDTFEAFLSYANGASLFAHTISINGYGGNFARSVKLEDQAAISILDEQVEFCGTEPHRWREGWTRVGGVVGWDSLCNIELNTSGACMLIGSQGGLKLFGSFNECLNHLVTRIAPCFTCQGLVDETYSELEAVVAGLPQTH